MHPRIDHGAAQVFVPQELLNRGDPATGVHQLRGRSVPQAMVVRFKGSIWIFAGEGPSLSSSFYETSAAAIWLYRTRFLGTEKYPSAV